VGPPVPAGEGPAGLAAAEGLIWVANYGGTLSRINARTGRLVGPRITTGRGANGVVVHQALIWVPNFHDGTLSRIERSP
jgi:streptogramin lyase